MSWWPLSQDYNEAIQNPAHCFADPDLRQGEAETNDLGLPQPRSGNFADVYAVVTGKRKWAVKCFTRKIPGLQERYQQISLHLAQVKLPFMVDFTFQEKGIRVRGLWFPILKMQWVEGPTLNQFVKSNLDKPQVLETLCQLWVKLSTRLREANVAHCDLQHGNVLLVPANRAGALTIKLVDYDGMCVPALTLLKSVEVGHPAYQHPQRQREGIYSLEVDRFSHLVIYTALRALMIGGRQMWDKHDDGDNSLFRPSDYQYPTKSAVFYEILKMSREQDRKLVRVVMEALSGPLDRVPLLDQLEGGSPTEEGTLQHVPASLVGRMAGTAGAHPSPDRLHAFGLGKLDDLLAQQVIDHVTACPSCARVVAAQSGDDFLLRLRGAQPPAAGTTPVPVKLGGLPSPQPTSLVPGVALADGDVPPELAASEQYAILRELGGEAWGSSTWHAIVSSNGRKYSK